jgi:hypothetical protein
MGIFLQTWVVNISKFGKLIKTTSHKRKINYKFVFIKIKVPLFTTHYSKKIFKSSPQTSIKIPPLAHPSKIFIEIYRKYILNKDT